MATSPTLLERMKELDAELQQEEALLWGTVQRRDSDSLLNSPKFQELVAILVSQPLLVAPALQWLKERQALMARAQLEVLYTPEQLEQMYAEAEKGK